MKSHKVTLVSSRAEPKEAPGDYLRIEFGRGYPMDYIDVELFQRHVGEERSVRVRSGGSIYVEPEASNVVLITQKERK